MNRRKLGVIHPDVEDYFIEKYEAHPINVVPGHWPDMNTKEDVDEWIKALDIIHANFDNLDKLADDSDVRL